MKMTEVIAKATSVPIELPCKVPISLLKLDKENPRLLVGARENPTEDEIITDLYLEDELSELLQSISANGYLDFEPLVVVLSDDKTHLIVLEGNRRLAAIMLLSQPDRAKKLTIPLPEYDAKLKSTWQSVRIIRAKNREAARPFIAFKHINGPHRWDSYAKAKFAADWYAAEKKSAKTGLLSEIATKIGDDHDTIKRMVNAVFVLRQAEKVHLFSIEDRATKKFPFSHFYSALSRSEYMTYLGLKDGWARYDPSPNPIPKSHLQELREVLGWIFGSRRDDELPVIQSQNPDVKNLGRVLANKAAVHVLRETRDLAKAVGLTTPASEKLSSSLVSARTSLQDAANSLRAYDGKDEALLDIAADTAELAAAVHTRMLAKRDESRKGKK
jgi:hypothetical protein